MPKTKVQKQEIVTDINSKLAKSKSLVFADYQGLTMSQLSDLRNKLAAENAEFSVTKNNLLKIALKQNNFTIDDVLLEGPIATLFAYDDEIAPIKTLTKSLKEFARGKIKAGILDGEQLDEYKVNKLAQLPSKFELRGKVVNVLAAPLQGTVSVLQANLRNLVYALDQVRLMRGGE